MYVEENQHYDFRRNSKGGNFGPNNFAPNPQSQRNYAFGSAHVAGRPITA